MKDFPSYRGWNEAADQLACFNCDSRNLETPRLSNNAPGRGRWYCRCRYCGRATFFDVEQLGLDYEAAKKLVERGE